MATVPSKRPSKAKVMTLVLLPLGGLLVVAGVIVGVWVHHGGRRSQAAAASSVTVEPQLDEAAAVAALRGNANGRLKAAAVRFLEQLAKSGNAKAMVTTAACYQFGLGVPREDRFKAFEWYRKAASAGEPEAMFEMAQYYTEGVWVEANAASSKQWLENAAKAGSVAAKWHLAKGGK